MNIWALDSEVWRERAFGSARSAALRAAAATERERDGEDALGAERLRASGAGKQLCAGEHGSECVGERTSPGKNRESARGANSTQPHTEETYKRVCGTVGKEKSGKLGNDVGHVAASKREDCARAT